MAKAGTVERIGFGFASVILLCGPLAIAGIGLWHVAKLWPGFSIADRMVLSGSLVTGCVSIPMLFHHKLNHRHDQAPRFWASIQVAAIALPIQGVSWALTHRPLIWSMALAAWMWRNNVRRLRSTEAARPDARRTP